MPNLLTKSLSHLASTLTSTLNMVAPKKRARADDATTTDTKTQLSKRVKAAKERRAALVGRKDEGEFSKFTSEAFM